MKDGNELSHNKDSVWLKFKINKLSSGVYRLSEFKHQSNINELGERNITNFGKNYIKLLQEKVIITG